MSRLVVIEEDDLRSLVEEAVAVGARRAVEDLGPATPRAETPSGAATVHGLDPHALYSRRSIAERWDLTLDTVRRIPEAELPTVRWSGGQPRHRGADVLRYEGVPETEITAGTRTPIPILTPDRPLPRAGRPPLAGAIPSV